MFNRARYLRWGLLFVTFFVEALAFWFGGPQSDPQSGLGASIAYKMANPSSWAWLGWASLSMAWFWAEFAFVFFSNGRRTRGLLKKSNHEQLIFDTGVHWLVLLRDIRINQLNDGNKEKLEASLFAGDAKRSFAWYAIWLPVCLAALTLFYYIGWLAWSLRSVPEMLESLSASIQTAIQTSFTGGLSVIGEPLAGAVAMAPQWLEAFYSVARQNSILTLAVIFGIGFLLSVLARLTKPVMLISWAFRIAARLSIFAGLFAVLSTEWFDWLSPIYTTFPYHGIVAMGFFPLTLASAFYFPQILFWSSWRYAIIRDTETHDATLLILGGVLNTLQQRINLQRIVDTDIFQLWWQRLLNVGDIDLKEMGGSESEKVRHAYDPHRLLDEIRGAIREGKLRSNTQSEFDETHEDAD